MFIKTIYFFDYYMKLSYIQLWEILLTDNSIQSDGCSLHLTIADRDFFLDKMSQSNDERPCGIYEKVFVSDLIWEIVKKEKSVRISEVEFNNSLNLKNIKVYENV